RRLFAAWARANASSHQCLIVARGDAVIGMAWLAILPRGPSGRDLTRASGGLQWVYVVPGGGDGGLGSQVLGAVLRRARALGLERVTVPSSARAIPVYLRRGFASSPDLLHAKVAAPSS